MALLLRIERGIGAPALVGVPAARDVLEEVVGRGVVDVGLVVVASGRVAAPASHREARVGDVLVAREVHPVDERGDRVDLRRGIHRDRDLSGGGGGDRGDGEEASRGGEAHVRL
jgi:hypothetical protein